jgi:MATE family multidrug resistance protein
MVAQALGARDIRNARRIVRQGCWVAITLCVVLLPIAGNIRPIYLSIGQDPGLSAMAEEFSRAAMWLFIPAFLLIVVRSFLSAVGATRAILVITLCGVVVNFLADYALIFGNWGFPRLELAGAGIATTLVNVAMLALMVGYVSMHRRYRRYHLFARPWRPDWPRYFENWRIGGPIGLMLLAEVGLFSSAALLQGWIGVDEVAAHGIALQLASIAFMLPLGLAQATAVRVGRAAGEGNAEGVRKAGWTAFSVSLGFMAIAAIIFVAVPNQLVTLYLADTPENARPLSLAVSFLLVAALFQLFDGTQATMSAVLRGLSDTRMPLVIALVGYWAVGCPVGYFLAFHTDLRGVGVWFGLAAGLAAVAVALVVRFAMRERLHLLERLALDLKRAQ